MPFKLRHGQTPPSAGDFADLQETQRLSEKIFRVSLVWVLQGDGVQEEKGGGGERESVPRESSREALRAAGRSDPSEGGKEPADPLFDCDLPPQLGVCLLEEGVSWT